MSGERQRITSYSRDGLTFDVTDQGPLDGDVVILLHGFPQTSRCWARLAPLLHAAGYRTLAPDQRGYSPRARPRGRLAYRLSALVGDVVALIDTANAGRVHVVGHDWGAAVAWTLAATRPDALATVTALSVAHPAAFLRAMFTSRQFLRSWYMFAFQPPWLPEAVLRRIARRSRPRLLAGLSVAGLEDDAARDVAVLEAGGLTPALHWYRAMPFNPPGRLAPVTVPTLFVNSDADPALGPEAAALTARHVSGPYTAHTLRGVGHWIPQQSADDVAALLIPHLNAHR
ncbi:alpha/beta fold hydrolase [Actinocorallia sp. A-T 12471]|uniref:alpha/beta fold hydrolase n=1 Tax=Actinocorallia sp. A-T 12471 TaxID=3089813 RepID=UPI0029CE770B|nr:alpha/beta fold hydrolase [Actinocorallia sp. A-T 12471]MDX6743923.1 alpha/beta fold hydrolase [Actinocorallia sp. A-T 12471]